MFILSVIGIVALIVMTIFMPRVVLVSVMLYFVGAHGPLEIVGTVAVYAVAIILDLMYIAAAI